MTVRPPPPPPPPPPLSGGGSSPLPSFDEALPSFEDGTPLPEEDLDAALASAGPVVSHLRQPLAARSGPPLPPPSAAPPARLAPVGSAPPPRAPSASARPPLPAHSAPPPPPLAASAPPPLAASAPPFATRSAAPPPSSMTPSAPPAAAPPLAASAPPAAPEPLAVSEPTRPPLPTSTPSSAAPAAVARAPLPLSDADELPPFARPRRRGVPAWLALFGVGVGGAIGFFAPRLGLAERVEPAPSAAVAASAPAPSAAPSASASAAEPPERTVEEKAADGDEDARATLNGIAPAELTVEQSVALSRGEVSARRAELAALAKRLQGSADLFDDPEVQKQLLAFARDPQTSFDAQELIASQARPSAVDLLFEVWTGVPTRDPTTILAERLVLSKAVRDHASPALAVALELRDVKECDEALALLEKTAEVGDRRAIRALIRLNLKRGCGEGEREDCFPCLRTKEARRTLATAASAAQRRDPPKY